MEPIGIAESLMYTTVHIKTARGSGTGFLFIYIIKGKTIPVLVTNQHVINHNPNETVSLRLHIEDEVGVPTHSIDIEYSSKWTFHKNKDLCFCLFQPLWQHVYDTLGKRIFFQAYNEHFIPDAKALNEFNAIEDVVMVGYPIGLWDERNNFPIFRKGFTSSHPALDFNEDGIGLVDIACFPGSSGSPIYIFNHGSFTDKKGNPFIGQSRFYFIGILYAGPQYDAQGEIVARDIPTNTSVMTHTPIMTNLGYYIKSSVMIDFREDIEAQLSQQSY